MSARASSRTTRATSPRAAGALLGLVGVLALSAADGGYFPVSWGWSAAGLAWVAAAGVLLRERVPLGRLALVSLGGLAGLTAWIGLSLLWTESVPLTALELERSLVPLAGLAAVLALPARATRALPLGVAAAATVVGAWNLVGGGDAPLGYANALALLAVMGALLVAGAAVELGDRRTRLLAVGPVVLLLLVVFGSESRASWLALAAGAGAIVALRLPRPALALAAVVAAGGIALAVAGELRSEERQAYWSVAAAESARSAPLGSGAGTWGRVWLAHRAEPFSARDAHSLYLETLSELGPVGLALVLVALVPPLVAAVPTRSTPLVPAATGAYVAFVLHAGVDWDWEVVAVALAGVVLGGSLLAAAGGAAVLVPRRLATALALAIALVALAGLAGNVLTSRAAGRLAGSDPGGASTAARHAADLAPWAAEPWRLLGESRRAEGDRAGAAASFREGLERDDGDLELWRALARVASGEELRRARERAAQLDPLDASG